MEDRGHERCVVQMHLGEDPGHRQRVINIGLAGFPELAFVALCAKEISLADLVDLRLGQVGLQYLGERINAELSGYPLIANGIVEATEHSETI
jgi:hypothetical protein